ncbi:MAG: ABC transporter permease, partial [Chloroflexota bacterium]
KRRGASLRLPCTMYEADSMWQLVKIAYRGLGRNRRRSLLSALALGMGVALLMMGAAFIEGEMRSSLQLGISLETGHVQVRARAYDEAKASLAWEDLVADPQTVASQVAALAPVRLATPRLYASGILLTGVEALGVRLLGIDPASDANAVYRKLLSGAWLAPDDREGVLIGASLASKRNLTAGDRINLLVNTSNGEIDEQRFVVRGVYTTHTPTHDQRTILMPLAKAQAITQASDRASTIWVLLDDMYQADAVAAALVSQQYEVKTWEQMNTLQVEFESYAGMMMSVFYLIVLGITATVVVNAMVMAVFERTREIGILAAIGMKGRRILALFLTEAFLLAAGGIAIGLLLGGLGVLYFSTYGIYLGDMAAEMGLTGFALGDRLYGYLTAQDAINLIVTAFVVTLLASLYPALLAARMEPVQALRGGKA